MDPDIFPFRKLEWRQFFHQYTTPRDWKKGARDIPFGLGAKTLYVDGTDGNDHNDGLSWKTAFKTIQHAIDEASSWSTIFIKNGTYYENVIIDSKHSIHLIGESRENTLIVAPTGAGSALYGSSVVFEDSFSGAALNLKLKSEEYYGIYFVNSDAGLVQDCFCFDCHGGISLYDSDDCKILRNKIDGNGQSPALGYGGIRIDSSSLKAIVRDNSIYNYNEFAAGVWMLGDEGLILNNDLSDLYYGVYVQTDLTKCSIFHNNFENISTAAIRDDSGNADVRENFYDDHSNIDNGFGIATEPYSFTGGSDPRPVVCRNGWLVLSWADADQVALASVCTEARLSELDAANIPADIDTLLARLTDARAGYLDNLSGGAVALASVCTDARLAELDAANIPSDIDTLLSRLTDARAGYLDELDAANIPADIDTLLSRLTAARAGYLDELDFDLDARLGSPVSSIAGDIADLITRTKGLNDIHDDLASVDSDLATVDSVVDSILANQKKYWHWHVLRSDEYRVVRGTWSLSTYTDQYLGCLLYNSSNSFDDEIAIPCFVPSTDARTLNVRCMTNIHSGIFRVYVDDQLQGTIDFYSSSTQYNVIKTISITPVRAGINVISLLAFDSNPSSDGVYCYLSEMWLT